ncbi:DUF4174 domain-containing protein [Marinobacter orientalis]|uniref:DUF4174 domain-containing protein n=1 Tax=Marinobacter orientalis TaxID=1928859 RepID=A0A7Y0RDQ2_9GAMM|nr:DUF4174 domain-containing protein [Marinobacter orientalis]NMT64340.1 DUF4174 domain-containing protein [Marinobacter orientalis]TGX50688.1 DUF4174 domain-containing protein [Marinobacter orientalis]
MSFNFVATRRQTILTVVLSLITLTTLGADMNRLSDYQWKNRLILVQAANENGGEIETLKSARAAVDDRDIVWFVNTGSDVVSNQKPLSGSLESDVKTLLEESRSDARVLLIGKDGGIKSRESSLDLGAIFRRIDAMPMRIREMRTN